MLDDTIELLTKQMLEDRFNDVNGTYIVSKEDLYKFCIKLIKLVKEVYER